MKAEDIIASKRNFPCVLNKEEGEIIKKEFHSLNSYIDKQKDLKDIELKYTKSINGSTYVLIEEFMFREKESVLDINEILGVNYYLFLK